jgi:hypothetical protein
LDAIGFNFEGTLRVPAVRLREDRRIKIPLVLVEVAAAPGVLAPVSSEKGRWKQPAAGKREADVGFFLTARYRLRPRPAERLGLFV